MTKGLSFLFDLMFRPDKLDGVSYTEDPRFMSDQDLVLEAANILDESEFEVLCFVSEQTHCSLDYDEWMRTNQLPPMMRHWLRENIHHLRKRVL